MTANMVCVVGASQNGLSSSCAETGFRRCHPVMDGKAFGALILLAMCVLLIPEPAYAGISCRWIPPRTGGGDISRITASHDGVMLCERTFESRGAGSGRDWNRGNSRDRGAGGENAESDGVQNDQNLKPKINCPVAGNPVVISNGNKFEKETDFVSLGQMPLFLERIHNSYTVTVTLFGYNWTSNFDYRLSFGTSSAFGPTGTCYARPSVAECSGTSGHANIYAHRPDGRIIKFVKNPTTGVYWEEKTEPRSRIERQGDGSWLLTFEDNLSELYRSGGLPAWIQDEQGLRWTYTYGGLSGTQVQRVTHTNGRYVSFLWVDDELREIRDPAGNAYAYTYYNQKVMPGLHTLKTVSLPGSPATMVTYHYAGESGEQNTGGGLTGKSFNGVRYSTFGYVGNRAVSTKHAGNVDLHTFSYVDGANGAITTTVTNPLGKQTTYDFVDDKLIAVTGHPSANCPYTASDITYDANGYRDKVTDFNGSVADLDYNAKGQLVKRVDGSGTPLARTTTYAWDAAKNRISSETVADLNKTEYTYTVDNRIASVKVTNLSANGVANQSRTTTYAYTKHPNGLLATETVDGPIAGTADRIVYSHDNFGNLTSVQNGLNHTITYASYDALGRPGRVTGANGEITEFTYDARGRLITSRDWVNGAWQTTTLAYNAAGLVSTVQKPDGQVRTYEYDAARRLIREYEPSAPGVYARKRYTYNNASLVTRIDTENAVPPASAPAVSAPPTSSNGAYTVSWGTVSDTTAYRLEERFNGGGWAEVHNGGGNSKAFSGKPIGTFGYRARACNNEGCSAYSSVANVEVTQLGPPAAPTLTQPYGYNYGGSYNVVWGAVAGATGYRLEENKNGGAWTEVYAGGATTVGRTKNVSADFSYRAKACNAAGCGNYSAIRTVTVEVGGCPTCRGAEPPPGEDPPDDGDGDGAGP